jgi:hypothetical protein
MTQGDKNNTSFALEVSNVISKELCHFLTHVMMRQSHEMDIQGIPQEDSQIKNALSIMRSDIMFDTINERIWPVLEEIVGEELLPTYSYARLYQNGNVLEKHKDRPPCEISISIQLGRSHHYSWPLYIDKKRFDLAEGDGVIYTGCDTAHWRNACDGPEGYYSGQVFCHYVRKNGPYAEYAGDKRWRGEMPFERMRMLVMETK